jgi:UDP-N-acetylglucosamine acyltransferase
MLKYKLIKGNKIHSTAVVNWSKVILGKNNIIGPYVVLGNHAQHPKKKSFGKIKIGNNNTFNEYCNIHLPTKLSLQTIIGNNNYFMNSTTIDHDCTIEDNVILSSNVILGGNVYIMKGAQLGIKTTVHQNQTIGSYTMIGMNSVITKKKIIRPGYIFYGKSIKKIKKNLLGLKRNNINSDSLKKESIRFKMLLKNRK